MRRDLTIRPALALLAPGAVALVALVVPALRAAAAVTPTGSVAADTTPPQTRILRGPPQTIWVSPSRFRFGASEAGSRFSCKLDDGGWARCPSRVALQVEAGWHTLEVRARDAAGNLDATPVRRVWRFQPRVG